ARDSEFKRSVLDPMKASGASLRARSTCSRSGRTTQPLRSRTRSRRAMISASPSTSATGGRIASTSRTNGAGCPSQSAESGRRVSSEHPILCSGDMTIQRMDNVLIVVDDLEAAKAFFAELGMELEGEAPVEGRWVDRVVGLNDVRADITMMRTPDG